MTECETLTPLDVTIELLGGESATFRGREAERCLLHSDAKAETGREGIGGDVTVLDWIGQQWSGDELVGSAALSVVTLVDGTSTVVGTVDVKDRSYVVQPSGARGVLALYQAGDGDPYEGGAKAESHPANGAAGDGAGGQKQSHELRGTHRGLGRHSRAVGSSQHPGSGAVRTVRVMFLYINGVTADQAVLHAAISLNRAKEVLDNSGLPIHLEQAGTPEPSNYNQTFGLMDASGHDISLGTDLTRFAGSGDPYMNEIHLYRPGRQADLGSLVMPGQALGDCAGIALVPLSVDAQVERGFSAMDMFGCPNHGVFAHEVGHNLGSQHNPENSHEPGDPLPDVPFSYSYGHWVDGAARDTMSYDGPCQLGCPGQPQYADPDQSFVGHAGLPSGTATRDADRSIGNTSWGVASLYPATSNDFLWFGQAGGGHVSLNVESATGEDMEAAYAPIVGDFNGPAFTSTPCDDIFWYYPDHGPDRTWYFQPSPAGSHADTFRGVEGSYRPISGDFDGDHIDDLLWYAPGSSPDPIWWGQFWPANFGAPGYTGTVSMGGSATPVSGDFDGDGRDDVLWHGGSGPDTIWWGGGRTTFGAATSTVVAAGATAPISGDFDGDGRDDLLWYGPGTDPDAVWWGTSSRALLGAAPNATALSVAGSYLPAAGDFDDDGAADVMWYGVGTDPDFVWRGQASRSAFGPSNSTATTINGTYHAPIVGNFDGVDGADIYWFALG